MKKGFLFVITIIFSLVMGANIVAAKAEYVIKFAHNQQLNSPQHKGTVYFKKLVEERSGGRIEVQIYPASQLGGMREASEGVQMGTIEMTQQPTSILGNFAPAFSIVDVPFLWPNDKVLWKVLDGPIGAELMSNVEKKGMKGFSFWGAGFKLLTANKEIHTPADTKGLKFRVMPNPLLEAQFKAWGAHAVPMGFGELYNALQQRVVDGQENPLQTIRMLKFWEVQSHAIVTNHGYIAYGIVGNKRWFDSLPQDLQNLIVKAEREAAIKQRQILAEEETQYRADLESNGMKVIDLTAKDINAFRDASKVIYDEFAPRIGKDFFDRVVAEIQKQK